MDGGEGGWREKGTDGLIREGRMDEGRMEGLGRGSLVPRLLPSFLSHIVQSMRQKAGEEPVNEARGEGGTCKVRLM